jgi:hypothetical protein
VGIRGVVPGEPTEAHIQAQMLRCKFWGGLAMGVIAVAASVYDIACMRVIGASLSATSLLIIVGTIMQSSKQVCVKKASGAACLRNVRWSGPHSGTVKYACWKTSSKCCCCFTLCWPLCQGGVLDLQPRQYLFGPTVGKAPGSNGLVQVPAWSCACVGHTLQVEGLLEGPRLAARLKREQDQIDALRAI